MFRLLGGLCGNTSWIIAKESDDWDNLDHLNRIELYLDDCVSCIIRLTGYWVLCDTVLLIFLLKAGMFFSYSLGNSV